MEGEFLALWNAKFGAKPPEWVFHVLHVQDVGKEISHCESRIEKIRAELTQELFLLEWLQKRTSVVNEGAASPLSDEDSRQPSPPSSNSSPIVSSPLDLPSSRSLESLKSRESSEYYSAKQQSSSQEASDSPLDSEEERLLTRKRVAHRVDSSDERVAQAVCRRLTEQGRQWSCQCLDSDYSPKTSPPPRKRSMSDPALQSYRFKLLPTAVSPSSQPTIEIEVSAPLPPPAVEVEVRAPKPDTNPHVFGAHKGSPVIFESHKKECEEVKGEMFAPNDFCRVPSSNEPSTSLTKAPVRAKPRHWSDSLYSRESNVYDDEERDIVDSLPSGLHTAKTTKTRALYTNSLYISSDKDNLALLTNGQSGDFKPISQLVQTHRFGYRAGFHVESSPESGLFLTKDQLDGQASKRSSSCFDDEECETPKGEDDTFVLATLTRDTVQRALEHNTHRVISLQDSQESSPGSSIKDAPELSMMTLLDPHDYDTLEPRTIPVVSSEPDLHDFKNSYLGFDDNIEIDEATISAVMLGSDTIGSRSNSISSLPGVLTSDASSYEASPPDSHFSPAHNPEVNLRGPNRKRGSKNRMGNAELDDDSRWEEIMMLESLSPCHTVSSRSSTSPTSEEGSISLPMSPSSPTDDSPVPTSPGGSGFSQPIGSHCSRIYSVRRSTVVVHGEVLVIRKLVVAGVISAEKSYIECLTAMKEFYRKPLLARLTTSQPIITEREINTIFYRVEDLFNLHSTLHEKLEPQLSNWSMDSCVGGFFIDLCRNLKLYKDYVEMYKRSLECLDKCKLESVSFRKFLEDVHATVSNQYKEVPRVNELLRRPIERLQSYSLVLTDLCQHTPDSHADYRVLRESLNAMSAFIASTHDPQAFRQLSGGYNRELVKEGLVVELSEDIRKVRRLFLFHDVLVAAKQKPSRTGLKFEPKWYLPLHHLFFYPPGNEAHRPVPVTSDMELSVMKNKIAELKAQLKKDPFSRDRASSHSERDGSFKRNIPGLRALHPIKSSKSGKIKKKIQEQQVSYWVASPSLPLRLYGRHGKQYVLLLHSEDERESWVSSIKKLQPKSVTGVVLSQFELNDLVSRQTISDVHRAEEMMVPTVDDEYLSGILRVRVVSASDLKAKSVGLYCCLELDEYGKFDRKARTTPTNTDITTLNTTWDQDFELEIVGAHIMKVMVCSKSLLKEECYAQGKIRLPIGELRTNKRHKTSVSLLPQGTITLIVEYFSSLASMGRKPALLSSGVFGVPLEAVSKRERHDIPLIVQTCVDEVERRGMSEVGVYRVAGVLRDVEELRQAFDTDYLKAQMIAFETDIHAVAGLLKRYFRELPDPLFTDELYMSFVHGLGLSDPEAREQCLLTLLHSLPPVNFKTAIFLFKHLRGVAANSGENKMTLNNLSTVFGPNLVRPALTTLEAQIASTVDVVTPVNVILYYLNCPEEYFDESLFKNSPQSSSSSRKREGKSRKKQLTAVEEEDSGFTGGMIRRGSRRTSVKRESVI